VYAPLSGEVIEVNAALAEGAGTINSDPYGRGWLVRVRMSDPSEADQLLSAEDYRTTLRT
jgi:glycine cleavage system H protein